MTFSANANPDVTPVDGSTTGLRNPWGRAALLDLVSSNLDAEALICDFLNLCEVWDDCIDREHKESAGAIHRAFEWALFGLSGNAFYTSHPELASAMRVCIANWKASIALEGSLEIEHLHTAYTLRCSPYDFFVAVVLAASGPQAADRAAMMFRGQLTTDSMAGYINEHTKGVHHGMVRQ